MNDHADVAGRGGGRWRDTNKNAPHGTVKGTKGAAGGSGDYDLGQCVNSGRHRRRPGRWTRRHRSLDRASKERAISVTR